MDRQEKINLLRDIRDGHRSVNELGSCKIFMLSLGKISNAFEKEFYTPDEFCNAYNNSRGDILILVTHSWYSLPLEYGNSDPSGEILQKNIHLRPELDNESWQEYIELCMDMKKCNLVKHLNYDEDTMLKMRKDHLARIK